MPLREYRAKIRQHVSFDDDGGGPDQQTAAPLTDHAAAAAAAAAMSACTQHAHEGADGVARPHSSCGCAAHARAVRTTEGGSGVATKGSAAEATRSSTPPSQAPTASPSPALSRAPSDLSHASEGALSLSLLPSLRLDRDDSELAVAAAAAAPSNRSAPSTATTATPSTHSQVEGDCWVDASSTLFSTPSTAWLPQRSFCEQLTAALEVEAAFDEARELAPPLIDLATLSSDETLAAAKAEAAAFAGATVGGGSGSGGSAAPSRGITPRPTHRHRRTLSNQITLVPAMLLHGGGPTGQLYSSLASSTSVSAAVTPNMQSTPVIATAIPSALFVPPSLTLPSAYGSVQQVPPLLRSTSALAIHPNVNVGYGSALHGDGHAQAAPVAAAAAVATSAHAASIHAAATVAAVALTARKRFSEGLPPLQPLRSPSPSPSASPTGDGPHLTVPLSARMRAGSDSASNPSAALTPLHSPPSASGSGSALHLPPPSGSGTSRSPSRLPWLSSARSSANSSEAHSRVPSRSFVVSPAPVLVLGSAVASAQATPVVPSAGGAASSNGGHGSMLRSPSPSTSAASGALSPLSRYSDDNAEYLNYRRAWELARHLNASLERIGHPPHYSRSFFFSAPAPMSSFAVAHADAIPPMHGASPRGCPEALQSPLGSALSGSSQSPHRRRASTNMLAPDHSREAEASAQLNQGDGQIAGPTLHPRPSGVASNGNGSASGTGALFAALGAASSEGVGAPLSPRSSPRSHLPPRGAMLQLRPGMSKRASMPMPLTPTAASSPLHSSPSLRSPADASTCADSGSARNLRFDAEDCAMVAAGAQWAVVSPPTPVAGTQRLSLTVSDSHCGASPYHSPSHSQQASLSLDHSNTILSMLAQSRLRGIASAALAAPSALSSPCAAVAFPASPLPGAHCTSAITSAAVDDARRSQCC